MVDGSGRRSESPFDANRVEHPLLRPAWQVSDRDGVERGTEISPGNAYFVVDVGCKTNDLIQWVDAIGRTHTFIVLGYSIPCGTQVLYVATIEERV
jgi:hypothetical protein